MYCLVRSHLKHLTSNKPQQCLSSNQIFFSIQQRIEAYKPVFNWNHMHPHVRLTAKDLHRSDFISLETNAADYNYGPLTRLLTIFACYNPQIGYSQGRTQKKINRISIFDCFRNE